MNCSQKKRRLLENILDEGRISNFKVSGRINNLLNVARSILPDPEWRLTSRQHSSLLRELRSTTLVSIPSA